jgi:GNAT superfamily N-acetyltransferase
VTTTVEVEEWTTTHARWPELLQLVEEQQQSRWVAVEFAWHRSSHLLVALKDSEVVGFLRFVTQVIGTDADHEPVTLDGIPLLEAKVLAFGVGEHHRNQGIGRALQEHTLHYAEQLGCYQVRSHSSGQNTANHHLKLVMGFGVHPVIRGDDVGGVYFIMPLKRQ